MSLIVGRKIILQQGDDEAVKVIVRDTKGREIPLSDTDIITLRMKYSMETDEPITLNKEATIITVGEDIHHILKFSYVDTKTLPPGDYYYDVILENENKRFTIVPKSILTLEQSVSLSDIDNNIEDIQIYDADTIDYESLINSTPLVGIFPERGYTKVSAIDNEIIIF